MFKKAWKDRHKYLTWFWIFNFPIATGLYFLTSEKFLLFYNLMLSVYSAIESSAGAKEAQEAKKDK